MSENNAEEAIDISSDSEHSKESSSHEEHPKCPICLAEDYDDDKALVKGCYHAFCFFCILQWAEMTRACPICKTRINHIVSNIDSDAGTFTIVDLDKQPSSRSSSSTKSKSMQIQSQEKIHQMARRRVYEQALKPVKEFSVQIPFGPSAALFKTPSVLENERRNWRRKLEVWIQSEAPVVFNHHLVKSTLHADEENVRDQEIQMLLSISKSLLEEYGDLRQCKEAATQLASLLGDDAEIFIRDLMLFLQSLYRLPHEFDQGVRYTANGLDINFEDAIPVDSDHDDSEYVISKSKRRKLAESPVEVATDSASDPT
eukprot:TRINITY_DN10284_c0_g1_i1.p1 TRINITY_DN10284_c0_g1~~TRINITY_DN10284_c0_g1_i1.p1  ORF type:complete len:314 (+),score=61.97 TRINITY_DN10284_c0_g1_i1:34-975(+)